MMCKSLATVTAALAILSFGSLVPDHARAGSSTSAAQKYGHSTNASTLYQVRNRRPTQDLTITEFSSSSAKVSVPKR
jgi:hypothetical protein